METNIWCRQIHTATPWLAISQKESSQFICYRPEKCVGLRRLELQSASARDIDILTPKFYRRVLFAILDINPVSNIDIHRESDVAFSEV
jgi:hypothetical protein